MTLADGMHYNPYFPGGQTGMAQALFNEVVEYEDGMLSSWPFMSSVCCVCFFVVTLLVRHGVQISCL